ncbi:MAG: class I SAM-dependent methyltransferase [Aphanothece sp. CMT-3BRIN-NPC111]|jgi:ubiquinone/menaquinone biosynthesis C-methylase UbiE|nr:class I SAM-dependent methyltransferase [Aphanothece sp. CMT-3BRIN-NPC111]
MYQSNFERNRDFWDYYAKRWNKHNIFIENQSISEEEKESYIKYLGDEWGRVEDVNKIVEEYITPFITQDSVVAEVGVGGGRLAVKAVEKVRELYCFDISEEMLKKARESLDNYSQVKLILMKKPQFEEEFYGKFDFVYSFDVFVHFDLISIWHSLNEIYKILRCNGRALIHTTNITIPIGGKRFEVQKNDGERLYFQTSPEAIKSLIAKLNMKVIKESVPDQSNFYLSRDYLVIVQKKDAELVDSAG